MKTQITFFIIFFGCITNLFAQFGYIPLVPTIDNKGNRTQTYPNVTTINSDVQELLNQVNINYLEDDIRYMQNLGIREASSPAALQTQNWLYDKFESFGLDVSVQRFTSSAPPAYGDTLAAGNVIALKLGTEFPDQFIIISSHYDHQSGPGADDNASGTAGVVECARILSQVPTKRSIIFVPFNAEESWLHGSMPFAIRCAQENKNILGVFNLDMLGFYPAEGYGDIKMFIRHSLINQNLFEYHQQVANLYLPDVPTIKSNREEGTNSDAFSFVANDYPSIYIGDIEYIEIHPCYHKPCDTIGEFGGVNNMNLVEAFVKATLAAVTELANGWLPPQNFSAVSGTGQIMLSWDEMPETSNYKVYKNDAFLAETTDNSYVDHDVVLGETYSYFVKGIRTGTQEESLPSNIDEIILSSPLIIPYALDLEGDRNELKYWHYDDWRIGSGAFGGGKYLYALIPNFSIMELDWFPIPENTTELSLHIRALDISSFAMMRSDHVFIEATTDRKTWRKLAKNIDFSRGIASTLNISLNEFIGAPFFQLRIRLGASGAKFDAGRIRIYSLGIDHTPVSIKENEKIAYFNNFQIYPNPTSGIVTIKTESENSYGLAVYDLLGKKVLQENGFRDGTLDLSALPKGGYLIQVLQDGHQVVKKVVVQ